MRISRPPRLPVPSTAIVTSQICAAAAEHGASATEASTTLERIRFSGFILADRWVSCAPLLSRKRERMPILVAAADRAHVLVHGLGRVGGLSVLERDVPRVLRARLRGGRRPVRRGLGAAAGQWRAAGRASAVEDRERVR